MSTPSITARAQSKRAQKVQDGVILSFTTVRHPPAGFPTAPRQVGLIELSDGTRVMGTLIVPDQEMLTIGAKVKPRMRLQRVNEQGLRIYDMSYEVLAEKPVSTQKFNGYILALTGPSGVGKTTISMLLSTRVNDYVEKVPILTTREMKEGDVDEYQYISQAEFAELQKKGEIVSATQIPSSTEKRWYGYRGKDIEAIWKRGKLPVVITEMHLLQGLSEHYGRRSILSCGLLPPGRSKRAMLSALLHRLRSRGRDTEANIKDRLKNAEADLAFFQERKELFDHLIVNEDLDTVATTLRGHVLELAKT